MPDADFRRMVDDARSRHNLSDIIGRHTVLKKRGPREMSGLCCFHSERTPSLEVNDSKGTYHCHGCGAGGDAIRFLMDKEGMTFPQAIETLSGESFPIISDEERARRKEADARQLAERIALARSIWARAVCPVGTPAEVYARSRAITTALPPTVRFAMTPRWYNPETGEAGRDHPAMVCALQDVTGAVVGVQCVFLQDGGRRKYERVRDDGTKAKAKLTFGVAVGAALRLGPVTDHIVLVEGPEDGLSLAQQLPDMSVWVCCGTGLMPHVAMPPEVEWVTLAGDNGAAGKAAVENAHAAFVDRGIPVREVYPENCYKDWNDQLRGIRY